MAELRDKTKIIFHKGTHTIGGTLVEISYNDSRIFFDLGAVFDPKLKSKNLDELLEKNLVASVDGFFDPKAYGDPPKEESTTFTNEAAFTSHVHLDHTSIINFTNPKLKVYASEDTVKVLEAITVENDFIFPFTEKQESHGLNIRKLEKVTYNESVEIGDIKVTLIPVDHDAYGACGFLIETPNMTIGYTGDIRSHGFRPELTEMFTEKIKDCDLLITEGVSYSFNELHEDDGKVPKEEEIIEEIVTALKENTDRQITFNYYPTNFERIKEIYKKTSPLRKLVLTSYNAYLVKEVLGLDLPYYKVSEKDYGLDPSLEISLNEILENKNLYLFQIDVKRLDIVDKLEEGGLYIHSDAEPLGDYDPYYSVFMDKFLKQKVEVRILKSSGHAPTGDLYRIIKKINPKKLAPIHSFNPERVYYNIDRLLNPFDGYEILFK